MSTLLSPPIPGSAADVADRLGIDLTPSALVPIDSPRLDAVARQVAAFWRGRDPSPASWDDPLLWNVDAPRTDRIQYLAVGNSLNFRFWRLRDGHGKPAAGWVDGKHWRGSMLMWRCLRRAEMEKRYPVLDPGFLSQITGPEFDAIFRDDTGALPLSIGQRERIANLRDLGRGLIQRWDGSFAHLVETAGSSLVTFANLSAKFRAFDDPIRKLTMVNAIMISGSRLNTFGDDPLPGIDYHLVKQLLRQGVLRPSSKITIKLRRGRLLTKPEANELRRSALAALIRLEALSGVPGPLLDNMYWFNRINCADRSPVCQDPATAHLCPFLQACEKLVELGQPFEITRYY